jgi:ATP-dependent protease ClpP protease subunit/nucleoside diphosphate kinase
MITIPCSGIIGWDVTPQGIREALKAANGDDVTFEVSSPGGFIAPGLEIFNMIRNYPGKTTAKLIGYAMSMASYIPLACDMRVAEDNAVFMIHNARGGTFGDHNDILGYGTFLKGLSGVIARQYVTTTGKSLDELTAMMDKETYFFGEEMVAAGFVHSIIKTYKDDSKDSAVAVAQATFMDAMGRMSAETNQVKADMQLAAAALNISIAVPPAAAGTQSKEVHQMKLHELLAADPAAKTEFDAAIAAARVEGEASGKATMSATIEKVAPFMVSGAYPATVGKTALAVLKGEEAMGTLTAAVAAVDAVREEHAATVAAAASVAAGDVAAQQHNQIDPAAVVADQTGLDAAIAAAKGGI